MNKCVKIKKNNNILVNKGGVLKKYLVKEVLIYIW